MTAISDTELWRPVLGGTYEASSLGQVRRARPGKRTHAGRLMKPVQMKIGYLQVSPTVNGKNQPTPVHVLVAEAFHGPRPAGYSVNHINGVKANNRADNLEYVTHAGNMQHASQLGLMACGEAHYAAKLSDEAVREIRAARLQGLSYSRIARQFGIAISHAWQIVQGNARRTA